MNIDYTPTRIFCGWSKTMSVTAITIADSRTSELSTGLKNKVLTQLASKIEESCAVNDIDPPFVEAIAKHFPMKIMKTFNTNDKSPLNPNS
mmetsp:Transcript_2683/g.2340  ORF Transcript_2683/g.2340 Transcript_2683/m.2340 type:complete len:91 (+) Transcript_2683:759-1031(+)